MANTNPTVYMNLPVPIVGVESGPQYGTDITNCLTILDAHSHTAGSGVLIRPLAININTDLTFAGNSATNLAGTSFTTQTAIPTTSGTINVILGTETTPRPDLWFYDGTTNIQITSGGAVVAAITSIPGQSYAGGTFTWKQGAGSTIPANFDIGSITLRPNVAGTANGITLALPVGISSAYSVTLPTLPATTQLATIDPSGNIVANTNLNLLMPTGAVLPYMGASSPSGYLLCNGATISRSVYSALFAVIGVSSGSGDGSTTFVLPDFRGEFLRGLDGTRGLDPDSASRTAAASGGNSGNNLGSVQQSAFASHNHGVNDPTHFHQEFAGVDSGGAQIVINKSIGEGNTGTVNTTGSAATGISIQSAGGNETRPINVYVNYIIRT